MRFHLSPKLQHTLSVVLIGCFGLLATGCSLGGGNDSDGTAAEQPVLLRVWRLGQDVDSVRSSLVSFKSDHPRVVPTYVKNEPEDYEIRSLKSMAGRKGPDLSLIHI
jgi:hypothetical protein